jgi:glycosyltransferase involved in cell wall biosynthesis
VRVLVDTTYARRAPHSGTGVYVERLCEELDRRDDVEVIQVWNRRRRPPAGGGIGSVRNLSSDAWWANGQLPRLAMRMRADLIHHPLPALAARARMPQVITVVDLAFERLPDCFDRGYRAYAHLVHRAAARRAAAVIAISETTARDVRECWGIAGERLVVAHLGPGQKLPRTPPLERATHFLYVGDDEPRKNLVTLLEAYGRYRSREADPLDLVLAGSAAASAAGVRVESSPSADRLAELLAGAAALVHPSLYEGFGLTPLEAMRAGTPVLAARSPGLLEICGEAAIYAEPSDADGFAAQMTTLAADAGLAQSLRLRGFGRAHDFSWTRCAESHVGAYSLALGG